MRREPAARPADRPRPPNARFAFSASESDIVPVQIHSAILPEVNAHREDNFTRLNDILPERSWRAAGRHPSGKHVPRSAGGPKSRGRMPACNHVINE
ncbi:MAG: hypothetical protein QOH05_1702 [Acetobacteraceae bacterium]|jgi:hypothetical protein|nr:hypothetical protein [Acetobacteraceae bacterium]